MSSTLSEGVRVPDIGSVNWGADVNFNWGLLNTALANISGNVKTDVANTWTATQTFSETISGSIDGVAARAVNDEDGNNIKFALAGKQPSLSQSQLDAVNSGITSAAVQQIGTNADNITALQTAVSSKAADNSVVHLAGAETITGDKTFTGAVVTHHITPETDNTYSLGSTSYQWASVYAQTYYYNGTQWGLDTFNQWTGNNKFVSPNTNFGFKSTTAEAGSYTASSNWIYWQDKNNFQDAYISRDIWGDGSDSLRIAITSKRSNGAPSTTGTEVGCCFSLNIHANGSTSITPFDNGGTDLGTSGNRWKSLNGINPGALGMIDTSTSVDIDTSGWVSDGSTVNRVYINGANPTFPGYLFIRAAGSSTDFLAVRLAGTTADKPLWAAPYYPGGGGLLHVIVPCPPNTAIRVYTTVAPAVCRYFACLGNV